MTTKTTPSPASDALRQGITMRSRALADEVMLALEAYADGGTDREALAEDWASGLLTRVYDTLNLFALGAAPSPADRAASVGAVSLAIDALQEIRKIHSPGDHDYETVRKALTAILAPQALPTPQAERSDTGEAWTRAMNAALTYRNHDPEAMDEQDAWVALVDAIGAMRTTAAATSEGASNG